MTLGHAPVIPYFFIFWIVLAVVYLHTKFEVSTFSRSGDIEGSQNLKVGHVTPGHAAFSPNF